MPSSPAPSQTPKRLCSLPWLPRQRASEGRSSDLDARIRTERIALVYDNTAPALLGNILVALLAVLVALPQTSNLLAFAWLFVFVGIVALRWGMKLAYDRQTRTDASSPVRWARRLLLVLSANGLWWGLFSILLLVHGGPLQIGFAPFIIVGMMAAAVATIGALRSAYMAFTLPMILCLVLIFAWRGDPDSLMMAGFAIAFHLTMIGTVWRVSEIVSRNIELKLQNDRLVRSLTVANSDLATTNRNLQHEIEERKRAEERSEFLATHDTLTGLPNRRLQKERFETAAERIDRDGGAVAILFIDLDKFKPVNDSLGHAAGDRLLQIMADRLRAALRQSDSVCRHGGDEFLMLLADVVDYGTVVGVAERVIESLSQRVNIGGEQVQVGCSIGISLYPDDGSEFDRLVCRADKALYLAKRRGRGQYSFFVPEPTPDDDASAVD